MKKINLHIGVHKTATTYLQRQLKTSAKELEANGVSYINFPNNRDSTTYLIWKATKGNLIAKRKLIENLSPYIDSDNDLIISDENIIGGVDSFCNELLYKDAYSRVKLLKSIFKNHRLTVYITVRNPATYFPSMYCEYLRHHQFTKYKNFVEKQRIGQFKWSKTLYKLLNLSTGIDFKILKFEDFKYNKEYLLSKITFDKLSRFDDFIPVSRVTITNEAIKFLAKCGEDTPRILEAMDHTKYIYGDKFSPYQEERVFRLTNRYLKDIATLTEHKYVELIS